MTVVCAASLLVAGCGATTGLVAGTQLTPGASPAPAPPLPQLAAGVQRDIAAAWPHMGEVWSGADYRQRVVILAGDENAQVIGLDGVTQVTAEQLANERVEVPPAGFQPGSWHGREAMVWNADALAAMAAQLRPELGMADARFAFAISTHELFHSFEQHVGEDNEWSSMQAAEQRQPGRGTPYPLQAKPRLYRASLINALRLAWLEPQRQDRHLAAAAYWHQRWAREFPEDRTIAQFTDIAEGTARYVEAGALQFLLPAADEATRKQQLADWLFQKQTGPSELDSESYAAGGLAGLLLRERGQDGWQQQVTSSGKTPIDLLLERVQPADQQPDQALAKAVNEQTKQKQAQLAGTIDPLIDAYRDPDNALVLIPESAVKGSIDPGEFYLGPPSTPRQIYTALTGTYQTSSGTVTLTRRPAFSDTRGGTDYVTVPIDPDDARTKLTGNQLKLDGKTITGTVTVDAKTDNGRQLLVVR